MILKFKYLIVIIFTANLLYSQNSSYKDSLLSLIESTDDYKIKVELYYQLSEEWLRKDTDSSEFYASKCLSLSQENMWLKGKALSDLMYGSIHTLKGNYSNAVEFFMKALNYFELINDRENIGVSFYKLAYVFYQIEDFKTAYQYNARSIQILEKFDNDKLMTAYNGIGLVYYTMAKDDSALFFFEKAKELALKKKNKSIQIFSLGNIANIYLSNREYTKALDNFDQVKKLSINQGDIHSLLITYLNISDILEQMSEEEDNTFQKKNLLNQSLIYADSALTLSNDINSTVYRSYAFEQLSSSYKSIGKYKTALQFYELFFLTNDSVFNNEKLFEIKKFEKQYQNDKQKMKLALIQKEETIDKNYIKKQKLIIVFTVGAIAVISLLVVLLYFLYRKKIITNHILKLKNDNINNQRLKIAGQRDKLSELAFELKKSNKTKDKFFSVLAHDLKNPFQSLTGFSELLIQQVKQGDFSNALKFSKYIYETSNNTYVLLENFLNWARVQTGVLKYNPEIFNLLDLVNESIEIVKYFSDEKQIKINIEVDKQVVVYVDKHMINTILRNLVSNAIKFTNEKGTIHIKSDKIENDFINIIIQDNGVGMKPEVLRNLFKISSYSSMGTQQEKGTGLGLIICKEFAVLNKGDLYASSEVDKGSTFTLKIPINN